MTALPEAPRVVLTGAGGGLGSAFAELLAKRRARMLLIDTHLPRAQETAAKVESLGGTAIAQMGDVRDPAMFVAAEQTMQERFGGTDLLINNAGVSAGGEIGDAALDDWEWLLKINLMGPIYGCHAFAPKMKERQSGAIINVASCAGLLNFSMMGAYNVSKAGVISLSETLHMECKRHNVDVTVLCPTFFPSNLMDQFRSPNDKPKKLAAAFFSKSKTTARAVADAAIKGLEAGELVVIPQNDGSVLWRFKRALPGMYQKVSASPSTRAIVSKFLGVEL